jgi:hypothetical protein
LATAAAVDLADADDSFTGGAASGPTFGAAGARTPRELRATVRRYFESEPTAP